MKVLYCYRYGILGGVCTQIINRLRVLEDSGRLEAHLLFSQDHGISTTLEGYPHLMFQRDPKRVAEIAAVRGYDAVVVIDTPEISKAIAERGGPPLVTEVHTTYDRGLQYLEEADWETVGFIVPSVYSKGLVKDRYPKAAEARIEVVPNGLDTTLFPLVELESVPSRPVFGWVGKLDAHKNWRGFLTTAERILGRGGDADFWMVGGETAPRKAEAELVREIAERGLDSHVRWLPRVEYRAMHRLYAAVRQSGGAMIVTSTDESFGMSVLEAQLCGCPVVASRVGGIPEIAPESAGFQLYPFGEYDEAATAALTLLDPVTGQQARSRVAADLPRLRDEFSSENVADLYHRTLRSLLESSQPGPEPEAPAEMRAAAAPPTGAELRPFLRSEIEQLRRYVPGSEDLDHPELVSRTVDLLDGRGYRIARTIAARRGGVFFWLTLPWRILRILRTPRLR